MELGGAEGSGGSGGERVGAGQAGQGALAGTAGASADFSVPQTCVLPVRVHEAPPVG